MTRLSDFREWVKTGSPWVWLTAGTVSVSLCMVFGLLLLIAVNGMGHFWPGRVAAIDYREPDGTKVKLFGEVVDREEVPAARLAENGYRLPDDGVVSGERLLVKTGNRDVYGLDFRWIAAPGIERIDYPPPLLAVEREEWGNAYGYLVEVREGGKAITTSDTDGPPLAEVRARLERKQALEEQIAHLERGRIGAVSYAIEQLRLESRALELSGQPDPDALQAIAEERLALEAEYERLGAELGALGREIERDALRLRLAGGEDLTIPLAKVVRAYRPNEMGTPDKLGHYLTKLAEFATDEPREANTEGGIFPAIFGTVLMVLIMSVLVAPFGVVAAVYLREYAKQGPLTRTIRIAVNNLAGVPSIVYGVFGLGFFVYFVGANIDRVFFPEALPAPTFGTPGLLWASLTLAILTVPVVIVATEEGLARIPVDIREGSLALGATKAETLWRIVLPMASPALMTGLILAVARAAGEVAPLMMVGVVKLAPSLAVDGNFPFLHLDRKIMHLGFHIYDVGFQSPNVEAARPLVYATALLLVVIVVVLNLAAIRIRNQLREKYRASEH
jgi:phosphate transport system permease protein